MLTKKLSVIIYTAFLSLIISNCSQAEKKSPAVADNTIFAREEELLEVLDTYEIPTKKTTVVLMPPTKCSSCKAGVLKTLDTLENAYFLAGNSSIFTAKRPTQKCIYYDEDYINKKGLTKLYPAIITIENRKVIKYTPLLQ